MIASVKKSIKKIKPRFLLISVLLTVVLWFLVMNLSDPGTYDNFSLTLRLLNEDALIANGKLIDNRREIDNVTINVHVTGLKSELDNLVKDDTIYAYVDLNSSELVNVSSDKTGVPIPVRISIGFSGAAKEGNYNITSISPGMIDIILDQIKSTPMSVKLEKVGELPAGYISTKAEYDPHSVWITGPKSVISRIANLKVEVDLTDIRSDIVEEGVEIKGYDTLGEEVTGFDIDIPTVNYIVPVYKIILLPIYMGEVAYVGTPAEGVAITGIEITPQIVEIMVHVDEAEQLSSIVLDPTDLTGVSGTADIIHDINRYLTRINQDLGLDLMLANPDDNEVVVRYLVEPLVDRQFTMSVDTNVHFTGETSLGDKRRRILTEDITVTIRGVDSVLSNIQTEDIFGRVDLTPLAEADDGEYDLTVSVIVPAGTELVSAPPIIRVRLTAAETTPPDINQSPEPTPENTDTP